MTVIQVAMAYKGKEDRRVEPLGRVWKRGTSFLGKRKSDANKDGQSKTVIHSPVEEPSPIIPVT